MFRQLIQRVTRSDEHRQKFRYILILGELGHLPSNYTHVRLHLKGKNTSCFSPSADNDVVPGMGVFAQSPNDCRYSPILRASLSANGKLRACTRYDALKLYLKKVSFAWRKVTSLARPGGRAAGAADWSSTRLCPSPRARRTGSGDQRLVHTASA